MDGILNTIKTKFNRLLITNNHKNIFISLYLGNNIIQQIDNNVVNNIAPTHYSKMYKNELLFVQKCINSMESFKTDYNSVNPIYFNSNFFFNVLQNLIFD